MYRLAKCLIPQIINIAPTVAMARSKTETGVIILHRSAGKLSISIEPMFIIAFSHIVVDSTNAGSFRPR